MEANATESTVDATRNATNDPNPFSDFKNIIVAAVLLIIIISKYKSYMYLHKFNTKHISWKRNFLLSVEQKEPSEVKAIYQSCFFSAS